MKIVNAISEVRENIKAWRKEGLTVGFVATMGSLHDGHKSLIDRASKENDRVVVSIFINPLQFGKNEDFDRYPKDIEQDSIICDSAGADLIFNPDVNEMYGENFVTLVDMTGLTETLCGKSRPGHFRGVCTVVTKLFNIVTPDRAYFGQKDAQQAAIVRKMAQDLNMDIEVITCPTVREADGLAKSSRNAYLNNVERKVATVLYGALEAAEHKFQNGSRKSKEIIAAIEEKLGTEKMVEMDYAEVVDLHTLKPISTVKSPALIAVAIYIGKTRLIDNIII
ncbi:MAG: pantoate--beta-alanine ligase [Anaerovoracaceae bacterium]|jgi:pantoate--beta-alanine ligase